MKIEFQRIGLIHSPYKNLEGMPIQPTVAKGVKGTVEVFQDFSEGLQDLKGFSHIILLYHFHKSKTFRLTVTPFLDNTPRGVFSTRAPKRPNPIGLSIVKLTSIKQNILHIEDVDILDETPLLDIKPYVPKFDNRSNPAIGWLEDSEKNIVTQKSDSRFIEKKE
jgi:tRNA-Thr(GGU) m(6)t(6)A37 methyltransferase TsaA